jgi:hypothetical protein
VLRALFIPGTALGCEDAADVDDDGHLTLTDAIALLNYLFRSGPAPPAPFPDCGTDPTADALECETYSLRCEGTGAFFVIDRSTSFAPNLARAKDLALRRLQSLPEAGQFGIAFFDENVIRFPQDGLPAPTTTEMKALAVRFVQSTPAGSGSCGQLGLLTALEFADHSTVSPNTITYLSDGEAACNGIAADVYNAETLAAVRERNERGVRIDTVGVGELIAEAEAFLRDLAQQNGGTYTRIP